ncbi:MAG: 4Fe-4S ferredoxin, partial [Microthrixaceae bacterium]|nr:4Fe-4S ferredoxin [Microthrixaceae bacterium]
EALWFGTPADFQANRRGELIHEFRFGSQPVATKVATVVDDAALGPIDVMAGETAVRWQDDPFGIEEGWA